MGSRPIMQSDENQDQIANKGGKEFKVYSASWVDRLTGWVNQLPGHNWSYYLGLAVILFGLLVLALWIEGFFDSFKADPAPIFVALAIPYMLAIINLFNQTASSAFEKMRPGLKTTDEEFSQLEYQLTTLPSVPTLLAGFLGVGCIFLLEAISGEPYQLDALAAFPISASLFRILYMILWWVFGTLLYHTIHQLRLIGRIYTSHTRINLFRMKDLYIFSNLIALTAVCIALLPIGFLLANPWAPWNEPVVFATVLVVQLIALVTFIWPHVGIHRLQVAEKEHLLVEANQRFETAINLLHKRVDDGKIEGSMDMNMTIASLKSELNTIEKIPTWPWQPETLRLLISALALPLGVWFIQFILQRILAQ
jgi:hypothetical protein